MASNQLSDDDTRVYQLAQEQKLDPVRAVLDNRKVESIADSEKRMRVRRHLSGVTIPLIPKDKDMADLVTVSKSLADRFESAQRQGESAVMSVCDDDKTKRFRLFNFLYEANDTIRDVVTRIVDSLPKIQIDPGDLVAVSATSALDAQFWHVSDAETLRDAIDKTTYEVACDFRLLDDDDTVFGPCMTHHANRLNGLKKLDKNITPPNYYRHEYLREHFFTIPFAYGNIVVLARICDLCLSAFLYANRIDTNKVGFIAPRSDGFGRVGGGPITKSEYQWDRNVVEQVTQDWKVRNGRPPSRIELQKALRGTEFIGEGSKEAQKITDKRSKRKKP